MQSNTTVSKKRNRITSHSPLTMLRYLTVLYLIFPSLYWIPSILEFAEPRLTNLRFDSASRGRLGKELQISTSLWMKQWILIFYWKSQVLNILSILQLNFEMLVKIPSFQYSWKMGILIPTHHNPTQLITIPTILYYKMLIGWILASFLYHAQKAFFIFDYGLKKKAHSVI